MQNIRGRTFFIPTLCLLFLPLCLSAQAQVPLSIGVTPRGEIPLGPYSIDGQALYSSPGGGADLSVEYSAPFAPSLYLQGLVGYMLLPTVVQTSLQLVSLGAGVGIRVGVLPRLEARVSAAGGYALGFYPGADPAGGAFLNAQARLLYYLTNSFAVGLGAGYSSYPGAYSGVGLLVGVSFRPVQGPVRARIEIPEVQLEPVFPVFYKYYDDHAVGKLIVRNQENGAIRDVTVSFFVQQYMAQPKVCATIKEMPKGAQQEVTLYALFKDEILRITEDTKVPAQVQVSYTYMDTRLKAEVAHTLRIHHRNAMTWDDDRKAAAFVNAKDPLLLQFAKGVTGDVRRRGATSVNTQFREAMGLFESLAVHGLDYVADPSNSYAVNSADGSVVDFLQFPVQTLVYRAGDCDDLAILFSALLEAVGIETAFITIPGHIYLAFNTGLSAADASRSFHDPRDLVIRGGNVWVPVEVTMIRDGFLKAWAEGAREWRESDARGRTGFYPVHEAWKVYEPVAGSDPGTTLEMPDSAAVMQEYQEELGRYVRREIQDQAAEILTRIKESNNSAGLVNTLGVLYARYGLLDEAGAQFQKAATAGSVAAIVNMGNLSLLRDDQRNALTAYTLAAEKDPSNVAALEGMAKVNHAMENFGVVKELYARLQQLDPVEAKRVAYLVGSRDDGTRAIEAGSLKAVLWAD